MTSTATASPSAPATSRTRQHALLVGVVIVTALLLAIVIAVLAVGGRPDPAALRAAAITLDGSWQFHIGDDPGWAEIGRAHV